MLASRNAFKQSRIDLRSVSMSTRELWRQTSFGNRQAWLDYYTSIYLRYWKIYSSLPPVVYDVIVTNGEV
jgi:hypothetical protein